MVDKDKKPVVVSKGEVTLEDVRRVINEAIDPVKNSIDRLDTDIRGYPKGIITELALVKTLCHQNAEAIRSIVDEQKNRRKEFRGIWTLVIVATLGLVGSVIAEVIRWYGE